MSDHTKKTIQMMVEACKELIENLERDSGHLGSPNVDHALKLGKEALALVKVKNV